jgi:hypothetical protein
LDGVKLQLLVLVEVFQVRVLLRSSQASQGASEAFVPL